MIRIRGLQQKCSDETKYRPLPRLKHLHSAPTQHKWNPVQHSIDHHCPCLSCWAGVLELRDVSSKDLPSLNKTLTPLEISNHFFIFFKAACLNQLVQPQKFMEGWLFRKGQHLNTLIEKSCVELLNMWASEFIGSFHVSQHASNHQIRPFLLLPFLDFKPSTVWHLNDCELQG